MGQFLKFTLASLLGVFLAILLGFFLLIGIAGVVMSSADAEVQVENQSILKIKLDYKLYDRTTNDPLAFMGSAGFDMNPKPGLTKILKSIEKAGTDPAVKGIYLNVSDVDGGVAQVEEIRKALNSFKESGKFIIAYAEGYSQSGYYLASVADEIYIHPEGNILFKGLGIESMFFTGTLEKLDMEMQVIRHGKFKAAVEPFLLDKMSDANREQTSALINSVWADLLKDISKSKGISIEELNKTADKLSIENPVKAVKLGFVDATKYPDEIELILKEKTEKAEDEDISLVSLTDYTKSAYFANDEYVKDKIAVIYATGEIKGGKGDDTYIGEKNIRKALIKAREDDKVKSIVLRVDSPGGSALVSDLIWREVLLTKKEKPVVVSMGNVAASGGYYISCAADYIYADPTTITGSIGVFGLIPYTGQFMTKKLGITFDEVTTNENAIFMTTNKLLSPYQRQVIQNSVERVYDSFITKVANGRNMTKEDVDRIGQGRVWSGTQALENGLIDGLGGLDDAIAKAAEMAEIDSYRINSLPVQKEPLQQLIEDMTGQSSSVILKYYLGDDYKYVSMFQDIENRDVIQARLPIGMRIQ